MAPSLRSILHRFKALCESALELPRDLQLVTVELFRILHSCNFWLAPGLIVVVIASALFPYMRAAFFGGFLDAYAGGDDLVVLFWRALPILAAWLVIEVLAVSREYLSTLFETYIAQHLQSLFPKTRVALGTDVLLRNRPFAELLNKAGRAEFHARYFPARQVDLLGGLLNAAIGAAVVWSFSPRLALAVVAAMTVVVGVQAWLVSRRVSLERNQERIQAEMTTIKTNFQDEATFKGITLFGLENSLIDRIDCAAAEMYDARRSLARRTFGGMIFSAAPFVLAIGFALWWVATGAEGRRLTVGQVGYILGTFLALGLTLSRLVESLGRQAVDAANVALLFRFLKEHPAVQQHAGRSMDPPAISNPDVQVRSLTFEYIPGRPVLQEASFDIVPGRVYHMIGRNGSGKTTFCNALSALLTVSPGTITIGGADVTTLDTHLLREWVRHLGQETLRLRFKIGETLAMAAHPDFRNDETLKWEALRFARLEPLVRSLPRKLDTSLAIWEHDRASLSGGEFRLLTFAMLYMALRSGRTGLLVLDEPFSSIDVENARALMTNLVELGTTMLIVTHDVKSLRSEDQVVFFDGWKGRPTAVHQGTHAELLVMCPQYRAFVLEEEKGERVIVA